MLKHTSKQRMGGVWVAQSVKHPTLDFGLGRDLMVVGLSPVLGSAFSGEPASLPLPLPQSLLSLSNK